MGKYASQLSMLVSAGSEDPSAVVMGSSVFWCVMLRSPLTANQSFKGPYMSTGRVEE
jgi:hypothetical protein